MSLGISHVEAYFVMVDISVDKLYIFCHNIYLVVTQRNVLGDTVKLECI